MFYQIDVEDKNAKYNREVCSRMLWYGYSKELNQEVTNIPRWQIDLIEEILLSIEGNKEKIESNRLRAVENLIVRKIEPEQIKYNCNVDDKYIEQVKKDLKINEYGSLDYYKKTLLRIRENCDEHIYVNIKDDIICVTNENKKNLIENIEKIILQLKDNV